MTNYVASPGQPVSGATMSAGDTLTILPGAYAGTNDVLPGGIETVSGASYGDLVSGTVLTGTADQPQQLTASMTVAAGGVAYGTGIEGGASLTVFGTISGAIIAGSGSLSANGQVFAIATSAVVMAGGAAYGTTVAAGADVAVDGTASGGGVTNGGVLDVFGTADGVTVFGGGALAVALGQISGTVLSGGTETVLGTQGNSAPSALATRVQSGGLVRLTNSGSDSGTVIGYSGREIVSAGSVALAPVISGGTLELASGGDFTGATFAGAYGRLQVDGTVAPTGSIAGFGELDFIAFAGLPADPHASLAVSGNVVSLTADGVTEALTISGAATLPLLLLQDGVTGGEEIGAACFCAGTAILTEAGERAVETIAPGDRVITADGRAEPVLWVGRRSYGGRFLAGQAHLLPIRIRAGALGRRLPRRDLLVSPCHAMLLGGVLVPAGALVDGRRITVERDCAEVGYVHIELARHEVILAEGAASETFLDDGSRGLFQAAEGVAGSAEAYCAPRRADGFEIEAIRRRLAA